MNARRATLALAAVLLVAAPMFAQDAPNTGPQAFYDDGNNFYSPENNLYPSASLAQSVSYGSVQPEGISVAVNDGEYIPSVIVNFDQAVAMGSAQLAAGQGSKQQEVETPSLAEQAREALDSADAPEHAAVSAQQDEAGHLQVCSTAGDGCRPLS